MSKASEVLALLEQEDDDKKKTIAAESGQGASLAKLDGQLFVMYGNAGGDTRIFTTKATDFDKEFKKLSKVIKTGEEELGATTANLKKLGYKNVRSGDLRSTQKAIRDIG